MTHRKEAFKRFIEKNPSANGADYETWHQVYDELSKLSKLSTTKKECWGCYKKLPKGHKSGLCSDCQIRG